VKYIFFCILAAMGASVFAADGPAGLFAAQSSLPELKASSQAIAVIGNKADESGGRAFLLEKKDGGWVVSDSFPAVAGKKGFAAIGEKKEGDGKSPTGIFALSSAFGYAPSCSTKMPYRQSSAEDFWVDDSESPQYNTWVHGAMSAKSAEKMLRSDVLYKWGVVVDYNRSPVVAGKGSAIFLHVWRRPGSFTAGCAAFSEPDVVKILRWLDPDKKPVAVMGIPSEIGKLAKQGSAP
jgi:L,D-peptidoglycan transpeptidase YkuD (ErfK/YbiS/YcfS/YnhG family)